jgi:hypothetical protein
MVRAGIINALSIASLLLAVNAGAKTLSSFNKHKSHKVSARRACSELSAAVLERGSKRGKTPAGFAEMIGLSPQASVTEMQADGKVTRDCWIADYEDTKTAVSRSERAIYLITNSRSGHDGKARYFLVSLDGRLEKSVRMMGKYDDDGKPVPGSGKEFDEDIHSPAVRKAFEKEMNFWLKDWLPKQEKARKATKIRSKKHR